MASDTAPLLTGRALVFGGLVLGFFIIPPLARANPPLINGFLLLILTGILLGNSDRWLPYLEDFARELGGSSSGGGGSGAKKT